MSRLAAVAVLSAATLGFEVLLVRMFSISQWHHFAYMIISLALLGYGASGTFLSFARSKLLPHFPFAFAACAGLFGLSALVTFAIGGRTPLNVLEIPWEVGQQVNLLFVYLLLAIPFFFAATGIGLALSNAGRAINLVYRSDLIGAGIGALIIVCGLYALAPADCLKVIAALGLAAAAIGCCYSQVPKLLPIALFVAAVTIPSIWPDSWAQPQPSPYKPLSLALLTPEAQVIAELSSPLGQLSVVRSPKIPFRFAPGLSLNSTSEPPEQLAVFTDGNGMTPITRFDGKFEPLFYLDQQTSALPYHLLDHPRTLVLGAGGGSDVLLARLHDAKVIDAVELNPQMIRLVQTDFAAFAGNLYADRSTHVHASEARNFVANAQGSYDLIFLALIDSFTAAAAGLHALNESSLYTVEAFETYLKALAPAGLLSVTRWLKIPPRDSLKLFATAIVALKKRGVAEPWRHLALIRGWRTTTLLVKKGPMTTTDIANIRTFCEERSFDVAYLPGISSTQVNRYNILDQPYLFEGTQALLGREANGFLANYPFDIGPSTDDRPYFFHFLKWKTMVELLLRPDKSSINLIEWGYPVILATLVQAILFSLLLIIAPLIAFRSPGNNAGWRTHRWFRFRVIVYFLALGLAFLFIEMAFIQRFQLFLGHPLYAVSVVLSGFLFFAGIGSGCSQRWSERFGKSALKAVATAVLAINLLAIVYVSGLPSIFEALPPLPVPVRIGLTLTLIAPIAFFMGMPFPIALAALSERAPQFVPWAWGINGCASVVSAVLATLLAMRFGFSSVVLLAVAIYTIAVVCLPTRGISLNSVHQVH